MLFHFRIKPLSWTARHKRINNASQRGANQQRDPEKPQLRTAQPPTKIAGPVLRAGLTDRLVTGMPMRWISVRPESDGDGRRSPPARDCLWRRE